MREGVTYKRLGDVATYVNGYAFKPETWTDHGLPIVRIQNLNKPDAEYNYYAGELPAKFIIEDGDLLISWSASLGAYIWKGGKAYLNQHIFKVVFGKSDIDKSYLKYAVESKLLEMKRNVHGSTMQHIVKGDFDNTKIPVPSLDEQQRIVSELDRLASIISDKQQQLRELDNLAQAIFYTMFGDPLTNPKGWEMKKLGDVCVKIVDGSHNPPKGITFSQYRMLSSQNILDNQICYNAGVRYMTEEDYIRENKRTQIQMGDVLMTIVGTVGRSCVVQTKDLNIVLQRSVAVLRPGAKIISSFLSSYLHAAKQILNQEAHGVAQKGIYLKQVQSLKIIIPPLDLQQQFAEKVKAIEAQKDVLKQSIAEFENLLAQRMELHFA